MSSARSLTEAVKQAAVEGASLTDAVKEVARSGAESTVVRFPRAAFDARQAAAPGIRLVKTDTPAGQGGIDEALPEPAAELPQASPRQAPRKLRVLRRARRARRLAGHARRVVAAPLVLTLALARRALTRRVLAVRAALRGMARAVKRATLRTVGVVVLGLLALVISPSPVGPDRPLAAAVLAKRVALVIGNSDYRYTRKLGNPRNDAMDVGAALRKLGFRVIEGFDLDKVALDAKIRAFTAVLSGARVGVFFYAGHGLNVSGQNYLVPVDAQLTAASAPDFELVRLDLVHRTMEREAETSILFFDACRDSPLSASLARAMGTRSIEVGRGLAVMQGGAGTLISFSTQPGTVALDGKGRNSPYSSALVRQLATSHEDLSSMMIAVRNEVMEKTGHQQVPWEHSALTGKFYFKPPVETARAAPVADTRAREAFHAWSAAKDTRSLAVLDAFITRYGDTFYAELARARMVELREPAPALD